MLAAERGGSVSDADAAESMRQFDGDADGKITIVEYARALGFRDRTALSMAPCREAAEARCKEEEVQRAAERAAAPPAEKDQPRGSMASEPDDAYEDDFEAED